MMNKLFWFIITILIIGSRCANSDNIQFEILQYQGDSICYPFLVPSYNLFDMYLGQVKKDGKEFAYCVSKKDSTVVFYSLDNTQHVLKVPIGSVLSEKIKWTEDNPPGVYVENYDRIYIENQLSDTIWCISGSELKIIDTLILHFPFEYKGYSIFRERIGPYHPVIHHKNDYYGIATKN
ncbi:MAG: hypothetical protein Fur0041_17780 [Bacteroidia bacterium]